MMFGVFLELGKSGGEEEEEGGERRSNSRFSRALPVPNAWIGGSGEERKQAPNQVVLPPRGRPPSFSSCDVWAFCWSGQTGFVLKLRAIQRFGKMLDTRTGVGWRNAPHELAKRCMASGPRKKATTKGHEKSGSKVESRESDDLRDSLVWTGGHSRVGALWVHHSPSPIGRRVESKIGIPSRVTLR
jgi:hypothetical protein